ncbi:MAG: PA domain-containing protein [Flavobacteriales bacterium]
MRKQLCTAAFGLISGLTFGQGNVVVQVLSPSSIADSYSNAFAVAASGWSVPDLTLPENAVQDELVLAFDGTAADSLACEPLVNGEAVNGRIAVIYRGDCNFSLKALNAQNAGARAVLLISNNDDLNINMQGGDFGTQVTIPVAMISQSSGAVIRPVIDSETVIALIGNNFGVFPNNLNIDGFDLFAPSALAVPGLVATDASEYQVAMGGFVHNFGSAEQTSARLRAVVTQDDIEVYNEVSENVTIAPGDSVLITLPQFTQSSYSGLYDITYTAESDATDEFDDDNTYTVPLLFGDLFSYVPVDTATNLPIAEITVAPATFEGLFRTCIAFSDTNASRLAVTGLHFAGRTPVDVVEPNDSVLTGLLVTSYAFLWTDLLSDAFTVPSDAGLSTLTNGSYSYDSDRQGESIYIPFDEAVVLEDNQRYLFCVETAESFLRHGWNETIDYALTSDPTLGVSSEPTSTIRNGPTWFNGFTGLGGSPALALKTIAANSIGINETERLDITPFPNPAQNFLRIPMKGFDGAAMLRIFNTTGAVVSEQKVAVSGNETMVVDLTNVANGTYLFQVDFENGKRSDFRVVVTK